MMRCVFWMVFGCLSSVVAGEIALSFDDAPRPNTELSGMARTQLLIENLKKAGVDQAVIFATTKHLELPDGHNRLGLYAQAGHVIANHSHAHEPFSVLGVEGTIADLRQAHGLLKDLPGFVPWFRYPFLKRAPTHEAQQPIQAALDELGYRDGYVTVDNYDWCLDSLYQKAVKEGRTVDRERLKDVYVSVLWACIEFYDGLAVKTLGRSPKHMLLLHENDLAAWFIGDLVAKIRAEGWTVIDAAAAYQDPLAANGPKGLCHQSHVDCLAREAGYQERTSHPSEDGDYLAKLLDEKGVFGPAAGVSP